MTNTDDASSKAMLETFGDRVARLMKAKGLTQTALSEKTGIERTQLNRLIRGRRQPHTDDALALAVKERLGLDPQSGALFVFASKRGNRLKVLWFDHNGYVILYKRLHRALFQLPEPMESERPIATLDGRSFGTLLRGVEK